MMNITFGDFESSPNEEQIKECLIEYFNKLKKPIFESVYVAYPHNAYSDVYEPAESDPNTLEMYIFSVPQSIPVEFKRFDSISYEEERTSLSGFQKDGYSIRSSDIPKEYTKIFDGSGNLIALAKDNKLWILFDIFHDFKNEREQVKTFNPLMMLLQDNYFQPLTKEEKRERLLSKIETIIEDGLKKEREVREKAVKDVKYELEDSEKRMRDLIGRLCRENSILEALQSAPRRTGREVFEAMEKLPFIEEIRYIGNKTFQAQTSEFKVGPFSFGKWNITINQMEASLEHEKYCDVLHPYEHDGGAKYCFGGFTTQLQTALHSGNYDEALKLCRLEITQYSSGTRMHEIEAFFKKIMGTANFNKIMRGVLKEYFKDADDVVIASIHGNKVTFLGKKEVEGRKVNIAEKVEIDYGC